MHLGVGVAARVGQHGEPEVEVGRLANGREHDPAGGDAAQHQLVGAEPAQQHLEVAARERGDALLHHDQLAVARCEAVGDLGGGVVEVHGVARACCATEGQVGCGDLRVAGAERDPDEDYRDAVVARRRECAGGCLDGRLEAGPAGDAVLEVHQQQGGGHGGPLDESRQVQLCSLGCLYGYRETGSDFAADRRRS